MKKKKTKQAIEQAEYQPTDRKRDALNGINSQNEAQITPRLKLTSLNGSQQQKAALTLLMKALGTEDEDFIVGIVNDLANTTVRSNKISDEDLNFAISVIKGIQPQNKIEVMLAAYMALVHVAIIGQALQLCDVGSNLMARDMLVRGLTKLVQTNASLVDTLKRHRTGGEQKVTVQYVSVREGGQAIVGDVTQAPPKVTPRNAKGEKPLLSDARQVPMTSTPRESAPIAQRRKRKYG